MKRILLLLTTLSIAILSLTSCNEGGRSLSEFRIEMGTVENPDDQPYFFIHLDSDTTVWVSATFNHRYIPETGQRIIADYTILGESANSDAKYLVKLNDVYTVLTKDVFYVTLATQDSIGRDKVGINDMWIADHYLNIEFYYYGYYGMHFINLVKDDAKMYEDGKLHLEFRHNSNEDTPMYGRRGIVSFDLDSIKSEDLGTLPVNMVIHVNEFGSTEEKMYEITYDEKTERSVIRSITDLETFNVE